MIEEGAFQITTMGKRPAVTVYGHDNNGNTLQESLVGGLSQTIYTYDHRNRMATSNQLPNSSPGQYLQTYTYDGDGLRRTKMTNSNSTFTYDMDNKLVSVVSSPQTTTYVWDNADYLAEETGGLISVQYSTMNGQLMEENRGGVVTEYVPDTLGSVIKTTDTSGNVTSSTTFWPYGETNTSTGTNPSNFGFIGTWGYYTDSTPTAGTQPPIPTRIYIRARTYRPDLSRWLTIDPLWPSQMPYDYCANIPSLLIDPQGLYCQQVKDNPCSRDGSVEGACIALLCSYKNVQDMISDLKDGLGVPDGTARDGLKYLKKIWGKQYDPLDCCRKVHAHPHAPGTGVRWHRWWFLTYPTVTYYPLTFEWIVSYICSHLGNSRSYCFIVCSSKSKEQCEKRCKSITWDKAYQKCMEGCEDADWGPNGPTNSPECQCGAKRGG